MPYEAFEISDFKTGLFGAKDPWISPADAFDIVSNASIDKGVWTKRNGYVSFANNGTTNEILATGDGATSAFTSALFLSGLYENTTEVDYDDATTDDSASWTATNATIVHGTGIYTITATAGNGTATRQGSVTSGKYYRVRTKIRRSSVDTEFKLIFDQSAVTSSYNRDATSSEVIHDQVFLANATATANYGIEIINNTEAVIVNEISLYEVTVMGDLGGDLSVTDGTETFTDDGAGTLTGDLGGSGSYISTTGQYSVTFNTAPTDGQNITASYTFGIPNRPVMSLQNHDDDNTPSLIKIDTKKGYLLNSTTEKFSEIPFILGNSIQSFTGGTDDYFWQANWANKTYVTNNTDQIQVYDSTSGVFQDFDVDIDGDTTNDINTCLMIFIYKSRMVLLRTTEANLHAQRARWSKVTTGGTITWDDDFVDAPTQEFIVSAGFLGEDLIVFFDSSVWKLVYTGNSTLPFRWERISDFEGSPATFAPLLYPDKITTVGNTNMIGATSNSVFDIDARIPDTMLEFQQDNVNLSYSIRQDETDLSMTTFVSSGSADDFPDTQLNVNFRNNSWSTFNLPANVFGQTTLEGDLILDDIDTILDTIEESFDDKKFQAGFPLTLMGKRDGTTWTLNSSAADEGGNITMNLRSARWNPYIKKGLSAQLGYVDFLVTSDPDTEMTVEFYVDQDSTSYATETVSFASDKEKVIVRAFGGAVGEFHRIEITETSNDNTPKIHAIVPYFQPAGRIQ
jgi:tetrahydromethanopterin S-methyltransferase subunit D